MLFAVALTLCTMAANGEQCETSIINQDTSFTTYDKCFDKGLIPESNRFAKVWEVESALDYYVEGYEFSFPASRMTDYDFTCERVE